MTDLVIRQPTSVNVLRHTGEQLRVVKQRDVSTKQQLTTLPRRGHTYRHRRFVSCDALLKSATA
jgi:hypothetical protein